MDKYIIDPYGRIYRVTKAGLAWLATQPVIEQDFWIGCTSLRQAVVLANKAQEEYKEYQDSQNCDCY